MSLTLNFLSGLIAAIGAWINSIAGGGTFLTFPLLTMLGYSALQANMISTIALWPGSAASAVAYRHVWKKMLHALPSLIVISLIGSYLGAWLLLHLPEQMFELLVPWLLLFAALLLSIGPRLKTWFGSQELNNTDHAEFDWHLRSKKSRGYMLAAQFIISIYGGYFGAGIGILMLAVLQFAPLKDIHEMNAVKVVLGTSINAVAFMMFIFSGRIDWSVGIWMLMGGIIGGYVGTRISLHIPATWLRRAVLVIAWTMTLAYFFITYR